MAIAVGVAAVVAAGLSAAAAFGSGREPSSKLTQQTNSVTLSGAPPTQYALPPGITTTTCPKGKLAIGGFTADLGFAATDPGVVITGLERSSKRGWSASGINVSKGVGDLTSLAYCGKAPKLQERTGTATVSPRAVATATATCPPGTAVRLGGFAAQLDNTDADPAVLVTGLQRTSKRTWQASGANFGATSAGSLEAIAYCGKKLKLKTSAATVMLGHANQFGATAQCPGGKRLAFGGFSSQVDPVDTDPVVIVTGLSRPSNRSWTATGANATEKDTPGQLTAYAYCS